MTRGHTIRRRIAPLAKRLLRTLILFRPTRKILNWLYLRLDRRGANYVYGHTAKMFRDTPVESTRGVWTTRLAGVSVRLPLRGDRLWLDWDQAVSFVGHEPAVKQTYRWFLEGSERPALFVDIGANYGTHSLLFLAAGVPTLTFEPNDTCHEYFREACALTGAASDLQPLALGQAPGHVDLYFPAGQTWLGSTEPHVIERLRSEGALESRRVEVRCLDAYAERFGGKRALVKIDAEGHELAILRGAQRVLREHRPYVIFEALQENDRAGVADLFATAGYEIMLLTNEGVGHLASRAEYITSESSDFLAVPRERTSAMRAEQPAG